MYFQVSNFSVFFANNENYMTNENLMNYGKLTQDYYQGLTEREIGYSTYRG